MRIIEIPYQTQLRTAFKPFAQTPYAILLDSGNARAFNQRYDLFTSYPYQVLKAYQKKIVLNTLTGPTSKTTHPIGDVFEIFKQLLADLSPPLHANAEPNRDPIPFTGGAMGYIGYDLNTTVYDKLIPPTPSPLPEGTEPLPDLILGFYSWAVITDHLLQKSYCIDNTTLPRAYQHNMDHSLATLLKAIDTPLPQVQPTPLHFEYPDYETYHKQFQIIRDYIDAGDCYQVNLAMQFKQNDPLGFLDPCDSYMRYCALQARRPAPFSAYFKCSTHTDDAILSCSPERFISIHNGQILTEPIKGTRPRGQTPSEDQHHAETLKNSAKDRAENIMIVDLLRHDLNRFCIPGSVTVPALCALHRFPRVFHLKSQITGILKNNVHPVDAFQYCFPGGSITGAPKLRAMQIIQALEPVKRQIYCGNIGYFDIRGRLDTNIAIRTFLYQKQQYTYWAGSGIVADSESDEEYREILAKSNPL
jgi:para-aminobenzoate synthetase component 1